MTVARDGQVHLHDLAGQRRGEVQVEAEIARPAQLGPEDQSPAQEQEEPEPQEHSTPLPGPGHAPSSSLSSFLRGLTFARMCGSPLGFS